MKIDETETVRRTIRMLANFLHRKPAEIELGQDPMFAVPLEEPALEQYARS
jgi:hypothetical protein